MKKTIVAALLCLLSFSFSYGQVDTSYIYNTSAPFGTLDIRIAKSASRFYYLQENVTFSFRENAEGRTNTYRDMTAWDSSPYSQGNLREKNGSVDNFVMNYRLLKPAGYDASFADGYPLIVLFHGAGERSNCWKSNCYHATSSYSPNVNNPPAPTDEDHKLLNNDHNLLHGGKFYMDAVNLAGTRLPNDPAMPIGAFPGFALFPQNLNGWGGGEAQDVIRIIRLLVKKYNINPDKIYLTGLSNGGHGALEALKRAPWLFAAGILFSPITDGFIINTNMQDEVAHVPLWIFQGGLDKNPRPATTRNWVKKFRDAGAVIRYTEYPELGHTTWYTAFKEPDFFSWLLDYSTAGVHVFSGAGTICDTEAGQPLKLPEGFLAYQWQHNGQTISGATGPEYIAKATGRYRGRFSRVSATPAENDWNDWSPEVQLTAGTKPVSEIVQLGTVLLRDLNNQNVARLESKGDYAHYYWYKDGTLIDLPGNQDDTVKQIAIQAGSCSASSCSGNGSYTLVVSNFDNCASEASAPKVVYFNDLAPATLAGATEFSGVAKSPSTIELTWVDNEGNETGYEIWSRRRISGDEYSPWEMVALTGQNIKSYTHANLWPSSQYDYKIRAVNSSARSDYTPAGAAEYLSVTTLPDTEQPVPPLMVSVKRTGVDKARLFWTHATDDSGIREYVVSYSDKTITVTDTTIFITGLVVNESYNFTVTPIDRGGNAGPPAQTVLFTGVAGLFYGHTPGGWVTLDSIDYSNPEYSGMIDAFKLTPKTQEDFFYFRFDGYLYIHAPGEYQFRTTSDDGSRLYLNGSRIVNNDGLHTLRTITSGSQSLGEGPHRITVDFFEYSESDSLRVDYKGPDTEEAWMEIPAAALRSTLVVGTEAPRDEEFSVIVFPNPTDGHDIQIRIESSDPRPVSVMLTDPFGRNVYTAELDVAVLLDGFTLPQQGKFAGGIYIVRVAQGKSIVQRKIIVHR